MWVGWDMDEAVWSEYARACAARGEERLRARFAATRYELQAREPGSDFVTVLAWPTVGEGTRIRGAQRTKEQSRTSGT